MWVFETTVIAAGGRGGTRMRVRTKMAEGCHSEAASMSGSIICFQHKMFRETLHREKYKLRRMKETLPSLPPSSIWSSLSLSLHLHHCPLLTLQIQTFTVPLVFSIDFRWPILCLMTGWLPLRKHFITAWYSKQEEQCREDSVCIAHVAIQDLIMLKSKRPQPCALRVCDQIIHGTCTNTTEFSQYPANVLCSWRTCALALAPIFICNLYNECLCFEDGIESRLI